MIEWIFGGIALVISIFALIESRKSAGFAKDSAKLAKRSFLKETNLKIRESYGSDKMFDALIEVTDFKKGCDQKGKKFDEEYGKIMVSNPEGIRVLHKCRRRIGHHYLAIEDLLKTGVVDDEFIEKIIDKFELETLFKIIEPMEKSLPGYTGKMYSNLEKIYIKKKGREGKK